MLFVLQIFAILLSFAPAQVYACDHSSAECDVWQRGQDRHLRPAVACMVDVSAPTYGGKIGLDAQDVNGKSLWGGPRIKHVPAADETTVVHYNVGCGWFLRAAQIVICADGPRGQFYSIRSNAEGDDLPSAVRAKKLGMCLLGLRCPRYKPPPGQ